MNYDLKLAEFKQLVSRIEYIKYTLNSLIYWDKITYMPKEGIAYRGKVMSFLADEQYKMFSDKTFHQYVDYFDGHQRNDRITDAMIQRIKRNSSYVNKIPEAEYSRYIECIAVSEQIWADARAKNDFELFRPQLAKIVDAFRAFAEYWGYENEPYDAMLSYYEDGMTVSSIDKTVSQVRDFLISFIEQIQKDGRPEVGALESVISAEENKQMQLWKMMLSELGFSFEKGRIDTGSHTTVLANSPFDVRIVNTCSRQDLRVGIFNALHSGGKGIYQQSISPELLGTFLAEAPSFAMEESVGKFYENIIGRSRGFWAFIYDKAAEIVPDLKQYSPDQLYEKVNVMNLSPVRLEADELTYLVHVIIRYELEKELMSGRLSVKELPDVWEEKYQSYLGVRPENHYEGVLQDIHWAAGYMGYFPSYFLSNIWAAQFAAAIEREKGSLDCLVASGRFSEINSWMEEKIFRYGAVWTSEELLQNGTGESLNSRYYIDYLRKKYSEVYKL